MFKDLEIMKTTLRYLLMVIALVSFLSVGAQETNQSFGAWPEAKMHSTSAMVGSGSTLPLAAKDCDRFTLMDDAASSGQKVGNIRKGRPGDWTDPYKDPIGDAAWPLLMLAAAYALLRMYKRKRSV